MKPGFKRVPEIDKCFGILQLIHSKYPKALTYNRSTALHVAPMAIRTCKQWLRIHCRQFVT
jgi:hypothetical protein